MVTFAVGVLMLGGTHLLGAAAAPEMTPDLNWLWASVAGAGSLTGAVAAGRWMDRKARRSCKPSDEPPKKGWLRRFFSKDRPWWHWIFIILGIISGAFLVLILLTVLLLLVAAASAGGNCDCSGVDCCDGADCCGGCDCGDCDCGGCDCGCN
ncbi:MAG: hypothetical protein D6722_21070 [Bacteroidetes bacterium]|nr:MAG: hypothetical protein D6722_21070 [Bacteroidota bacterium]